MNEKSNRIYGIDVSKNTLELAKYGNKKTQTFDYDTKGLNLLIKAIGKKPELIVLEATVAELNHELENNIPARAIVT